MANQAATASISASSSSTATAKAIHAGSAAIAGLATCSASAGEKIRTTVQSTGGFAGINVDPTAYVYAAAQAILAAVTDASNGTTYAQALLVSGPQPYVVINGIAGSPLATRTGSTSSSLSANYMIGVITGASQPYPVFAVNLWSAVANYLQSNPSLLRQDGFADTRSVRSDGAQVLDIIL